MNLHYLNGHLSQSFVALFTGRMLMFVANGLVGLFMPIFLLSVLNERIELVFVYYLIGWVFYFVFLPLGAHVLNRVGLRRSLRLSVFFVAMFYLTLYFVDYNVPLFLTLSLIVLTFFRILFWYPFHVDLAKFTNKGDRGKEISLFWATKTFLSVIMPIIAGYLIYYFNFNFVFIISIIIYLSVYIPFLTLPHTGEKYDWKYFETFKKLFSKKHRKLVFANIANGAENKVSMVIWPIFIYEILNGNFIQMGIISSLVVFVTIIIQFSAGKYVDKIDKRKMLHWGSVFYAIGWLAKIFVLTASQIFFVGTYHSLSQIFKDTPFDALNYETIADHGHYVDEFTVLKEMALCIGGILIMGFSIIIFLNFGLNWTFALAAISSLFINML